MPLAVMTLQNRWRLEVAAQPGASRPTESGREGSDTPRTLCSPQISRKDVLVADVAGADSASRPVGQLEDDFVAAAARSASLEARAFEPVGQLLPHPNEPLMLDLARLHLFETFCDGG